MTDAAKRTRRRLTRRQRWLLWFVVFLIVSPVAGWTDARVAVRLHFGDSMPYSYSLPLLVHQTEAGYALRERTEENYKTAWAFLIWGRSPQRQLSGLLFSAWRISGHRQLQVFRFEPKPGEAKDLTEEELAPIRPLLVAYIRNDPGELWVWGESIDECALPNSGFRGPLWLGIIGNGLVYSLIITPTLFGVLQLGKRALGDTRARRLRRGLCPRCRYQIQGLPENRCPECGETWRSAEAVGHEEGPL